KQAACSLCVNVGNFSDPPEFPGISYFLRYILFQDLKKSPEQCTLDKYIENHNGINNVSVDNEHTIFYFDIEENSLFVALKRFGDFFVEPIISKQVLIEQHDVQNEFQKSLRTRNKKYNQLFSSFAQTGHPANKFSADHLIKLHNHIDYDKLYNVLAKFKNRHYSAHRMKLAIQYIMDHKLSKDQSFKKFMYTKVNFRNVNGILGYSITVCTQYQYTVEYADKKIDRFLRGFKNDMEKLTKVELDIYKEMFLHRLHDDANLEKEVERNWNEIITCTYMFDLHEQEILALEKINVSKLREWLADHTLNGNNFRKLSLQVVGTISKKAKYVNLANINDDYQYNSNRYHYITKVEDYKNKLFIFPINSLRAQYK
ncbi:NRDC protein, partial [Acromyrmex charruanus]